MCDGRSTDWSSDLFMDVRPHRCSPFGLNDGTGGLRMTPVSLDRFIGDQLLDRDEVDAFEEFRRNGVEMDLEVSCVGGFGGSGIVHRQPHCFGDPWTVVDNEGRPMSPIRRRVIGQVDSLPTVPEDGPSSTSSVPSRSSTRRGGQCVFCRNNGESRFSYESHVVKDRTGRVTCPVLRNYKCPICGVSGDDAHTIRYCPQNKHRDRAAIAAVALTRRLPPTTKCYAGSLDDVKQTALNRNRFH